MKSLLPNLENNASAGTHAIPVRPISMKLPSLIEEGGRRAAVRSFWAKTLGHLRHYSSAERIEPSRINRIVFVCKGNICRSAYAKAYVRAQYDFEVASAGLDAIAGMSANASAQECAHGRGVDLSNHTSRPVHDLTATKSDLFLAFEPAQAQQLKRVYSESIGSQVALLGCFGRDYLPYIHDPYGLSNAYFEVCFSRIESSVDGLMQALGCDRE